LAVYQGDIVLRYLLGLAAVLATLSLPLWGGHLDLIALWFGSDTWNALVLLTGCICAHGLVLRSFRLRPDFVQIADPTWRTLGQGACYCRVSTCLAKPSAFPDFDSQSDD
jgi:hypothetical protein